MPKSYSQTLFKSHHHFPTFGYAVNLGKNLGYHRGVIRIRLDSKEYPGTWAAPSHQRAQSDSNSLRKMACLATSKCPRKATVMELVRFHDASLHLWHYTTLRGHGFLSPRILTYNGMQEAPG